MSLTLEVGTMTKRRLGIRRLAFVALFILGLGLALYPLISYWYYRMDHQESIRDFEEARQGLGFDDIQERMDLARAYNSTLDPAKIGDPYSEDQEAGRAEYARMLEVREMIGHVHIPRIDQDLPVYAGTSEEVLGKAAGHLEGTSLPLGGPSTHSVITAHRGLPQARLFRDLDKLGVGDIFYFHNLETVLAYQVDQVLTVEP